MARLANTTYVPLGQLLCPLCGQCERPRVHKGWGREWWECVVCGEVVEQAKGGVRGVASGRKDGKGG